MLQPVLHAVTLPDVAVPRQHQGQIRTLATELISSHFLNPSHARVGPKDCWGLTKKSGQTSAAQHSPSRRRVARRGRSSAPVEGNAEPQALLGWQLCALFPCACPWAHFNSPTASGAIPGEPYMHPHAVFCALLLPYPRAVPWFGDAAWIRAWRGMGRRSTALQEAP